MSLSLSIYIYIHINYMYLSVYTSLSLYIYTCICMCVYIYIYTHTHLSLYICIYIYIYTHTYVSICVSTTANVQAAEAGPQSVHRGAAGAAHWPPARVKVMLVRNMMAGMQHSSTKHITNTHPVSLYETGRSLLCMSGVHKGGFCKGGFSN